MRVLLAALVVMLFRSSGGYPWGAPESACSDGSVPASHGTARPGTHPFTIELLTEYTDVAVGAWRPGVNYDLKLSTPSKVDSGIGGFLVLDQSGSKAFEDIDPDAAAADHQDNPHAFQVPAAQLRCGGSGVTQESYNKNKTVLNVGSVRHTVRAPTDAAAPWSMRFTVLTVPYRSATSFHGEWPVGDGENDGDGGAGTLQAKGRVYVFTHTFPPHTAASVPTCGAASTKRACFRPASPDTKECFATNPTDQSSCNIPHADVITLDPAGRGFLVGGKDVLALVDSTLSAVEIAVPVTADYTRVLNVVSTAGDGDGDGDGDGVDEDTALLFCGTGRGRPHCSLRSAATLELSDNDAPGWVASGVVPRTAAASYGVLVRGNNVYAARNQVELPTDAKTAANVISLSLLNETTRWTYHYNEGVASKGGGGSTHNGLHRSTSIDEDIDRPWLEQPLAGAASASASSHLATRFTKPWTKSPSDGFVYFGVSEYDSVSKATKSRIARVCEGESAPPDANNFASFLKMEVSCSGGVYELDASQLTTATAGKGSASAGDGDAEPSVVYLAFQTTAGGAGASDAPGAVVCSFPYAATPYGIDYEMTGLIDLELNQKSFFSKVSGDPFSCTRSADDARTLVYVNPEQQAAGYKGRAHSTAVLLESAGAGKGFLHLATHVAAVSDTAHVEVLWAIEKSGAVRKVAMLTGGAGGGAVEVLAFDTGIVDATSFVVDHASSSVLVGGAGGVTRLRSEHCNRQATCSECAQLGDPDCGWCAATSVCTTRAKCSVPAKNWKLDLKSRTGNAFCHVPPTAATFVVVASTATTLELAVTDEGASASLYKQPTYAAFANNIRMLNFKRKVTNDGAGDATGSFVLGGLLPFTAYTIAIESTNVGGRATTRTRVAETRAAAPGQLPAPPHVSVLSSTALSLAWGAPSQPNGEVVSYQVLRGGERVCCDAPWTAFNDTELMPYTSYIYTVAAETRGNDGSKLVGETTPSVSATTLESIPGAPRKPTATVTNATSILVEWSAPAVANGVLTGYTLYLNGSQHRAVQIPSNAGTGSVDGAKTLSGLLPNTAYTIAVQAFTSKGAGVVSEAVELRTLQGLPGPPAALKVTLQTGSTTTVSVEWDVPEDLPAPSVRQYIVRRWIPKPDTTGVIVTTACASPAAGVTDAAEPGTGSDIGWTEAYVGGSTAFDDAGLAPCTLYFYDVVARTTAGYGPASSIGRIRTGTRRPLEPPTAPTLNGFQDGYSAAVVAWGVGAACDAASFNVVHWLQGSDDRTSMPVSSAGQTVLSNLAPGSVYYVTLQTVHRDTSGGDGDSTPRMIESPPSASLELTIPEVCTTATTATATVERTVLFTAAPIVTVAGETTTSAWDADSSQPSTPVAGEGCGGNSKTNPDPNDGNAGEASSSSVNGSGLGGTSQQCSAPIYVAGFVGGFAVVAIGVLVCMLRRKSHSQSHSLTVGSGVAGNLDANNRPVKMHTGLPE